MAQEKEEDSFLIISSIRSDSLLLELSANDAYSPNQAHPSQFYMLRLHFDRILSAGRAFDWPSSALSGPTGLQTLAESLTAHVSKRHPDKIQACSLRIRIQLDRTGALSFVSAPTPLLPSPNFLFPDCLPRLPIASGFHDTTSAPSFDVPPPSWTIYLSHRSIEASLHTQHKTSLRSVYDSARAQIPTPSNQAAIAMTELLLHNPAGEVMEGSLTTPYFWRTGEEGKGGVGRWVTPRQEAGGNMGTTRRWALEKGLCVEAEIRVEEVRAGEGVWLSNGVRGFGWGAVEGWIGGTGRGEGAEETGE